MSPLEKLRNYLAISRNLRLHDQVRDAFHARGPVAHNWDRIFRDTVNAVGIGEPEGADMEIVLPAVLLHDVGFLYNPDPYLHHMIGADKCFEWLSDWSEADRRRISDCIKSHKGKFPEFGIEPDSTEAKVVHDADMLEKFGHIGILQSLRTYVEFGICGVEKFSKYRELHEIVNMQATLRDLNFYTVTGQRLAQKRGGIDKRVRFFVEALREIEEYC
jgi:HD superfamily phosphodiesterase